MRTIRTKVYKFSELNDRAKETALENWSIYEPYSWADEALESLKKFAEHFNCTLSDYEIDWTEGAGYSSVKFDVPYYVEDWTEKEIETQIISMGSYNKKTLIGLGDCKFTGMCFDEDAADGARIAFFNGERDMNNILQAGYKTWKKATKEDAEYQTTEEYFAETCEANEYEFTRDGKMI